MIADDEQRARASRPARSRTIVFTVAAVALIVAGLEVGATVARRVLGWAPAGRLYETHPTLLWRMRPNVTLPAANTTVTTNSLGLRGPEVEAARRAGRIRLLVIGDSIGFGFGVPDDESWPRLLEANLSQALGGSAPVEVINASHVGYSTFQEAALLRDLGPRLSPDLVLWQFCSNDVLENYTYKPRPRVALWLTRSGLFNLVRDAMHRGRGAETYESAEAPAGERSPRTPSQAARGSERAETRRLAREQLGALKEDAVFNTAGDTLVVAGWQASAAAATQVADAARACGAALVCVVFPAGSQIVGATQSTALQDSVAAICGRLDVPVVDVFPAFVGRSRTYLGTHPTVNGNRYAAEHAAQAILPMLAGARAGD